MYVSGLLMCYVGAEVINSPLNHSVLFVKEKDLILTSDYWKIIVNFDLMPYEDVITTLREDLRQLKEATRRTLPIGELRYVETALSAVENKLADLKEYLPKADKRRGFLDIGGTFLKTLFGNATVADLSDLHATLDDLHKKLDTVVHSTNQQITYLKQLDGTVRFNHEAIANLSATLKGIVAKVQGDLKEIALIVLRNSKHIESAEIIRQLEFALTQLELSIDKLMFALQYFQLGKIPLNLISPSMLRDMLKNVSFALPGGYDLIVSLRPNNVFMYYEIIQAVMLADLQF
jgi:hypothetical protein